MEWNREVNELAGGRIFSPLLLFFFFVFSFSFLFFFFFLFFICVGGRFGQGVLRKK